MLLSYKLLTEAALRKGEFVSITRNTSEPPGISSPQVGAIHACAHSQLDEHADSVRALKLGSILQADRLMAPEYLMAEPVLAAARQPLDQHKCRHLDYLSPSMSCGMHTSSCAAGCFLLDDQILGICIFCLHDFPLNISPAQIVLELKYIVVQVKMLTPEARQLR